MGDHNVVAVEAVVAHNAVAAVAVVAGVVAVGAESQGIVEVDVAAAVGGFAFLDTPGKKYDNFRKKILDFEHFIHSYHLFLLRLILMLLHLGLCRRNILNLHRLAGSP